MARTFRRNAVGLRQTTTSAPNAILILARGQLHPTGPEQVRSLGHTGRVQGGLTSDPEGTMRPTRGVRRLTTSAVASVDSIGRRADAHCQVGSYNCVGKRS